MVTGHFTTPPPEGVIYAPMDIAVAVADGLAERGHQVDFYGPEGTELKSANVITANLKPLKQNGDFEILNGPEARTVDSAKIFNLWDQYLIAQMFKSAAEGKYDLLHIHPVDRALPLAMSHANIQVVYTLHDPIFKWRAKIFSMFQTHNQQFISISDAQRKPAPGLKYAETIYNGIDTNLFSFSKDHDDYLFFAGRLLDNKGVFEAIMAARQAGEKLLIAGTPAEGPYWEEKIKPYLDDKIQFVGFIPYKDLNQYYRRAKAVLVPIQWEEPFGLVMTESMACGTPVIAFNRGSVPEVVVDGKTGFIVNTVGEMAAAIKKIDKISRAACRKHVEENFTVEKMVDDYEKLFLKIISQHKTSRS